MAWRRNENLWKIECLVSLQRLTTSYMFAILVSTSRIKMFKKVSIGFCCGRFNLTTGWESGMIASHECLNWTKTKNYDVLCDAKGGTLCWLTGLSLIELV